MHLFVNNLKLRLEYTNFEAIFSHLRRENSEPLCLALVDLPEVTLKGVGGKLCLN